MSLERREGTAIVCDECGAETRAHPKIAESGWMRYGFDHGIGTDKIEKIYCPECWARREAR